MNNAKPSLRGIIKRQKNSRVDHFYIANKIYLRAAHCERASSSLGRIYTYRQNLPFFSPFKNGLNEFLIALVKVA